MRRHRAWLVGLCVSACVGLGVGVGGCSLLVARPDECSSDIQCREAFGWGATCGVDGYCEAPNPPPRCTSTYPEQIFENPTEFADHRIIGALFDAQAHLDSVQATQLAILEVNEAEGLDGRKFGVVFCDYGEGFDDGLDSLEASAEGAVWLADVLGVTAIVGPRGSSRTEAAFEALDGRDVLLISPSATSPLLTDIDETSPTDDNPGLLWRTAPPDDIQAAAIVTDLLARDVSSVVIVSQEGAYGDALAELIETGYLAANGGTVERFSFSGSLFGAVADAAAVGADEVVFISSDTPDYVDFFNGAVSNASLETTFEGMGIFLPDAAFNQQFLDGVDVDAHVLFDNVRGTRYLPAEGSLFNTFSAAFATQYGGNPEASGFTVHTYDAAWLVFYATAWAHFNESDEGGRNLARGLRKITGGTPIDIRFSGWAEVLAAFGSGERIDVQGGSGSLDYDPNTEETQAAVEVWGIDEVSAGQYGFVRVGVIE